MNSKTRYYAALVLYTAVYIFIIVYFWNSKDHWIISVCGAFGIFGNTLIHLLRIVKLKEVDRKYRR